MKTDTKYIRILSRTVFVKIKRGKDIAEQHFPIRDFSSLEECLGAAIDWRDAQHLSMFGYPVSDSIVQLRKKKPASPKNDQTQLPELPPRLSYGFMREKLYWIVVSHQEGKKTKRTRIPINPKNINETIEAAVKLDKDNQKKSAILK